MPAIHNIDMAQASPPAVVAYAAPESAAQRLVRERVEPRLPQAPSRPAGAVSVELPARIPAACVYQSAQDYALNPFILLALLKVESNGRTGVVSRNTNGTYDLGPAQFNTASWAAKLETQYKIPRQALVHDMCQAIRAMAFAVRTEINNAGGDVWRGIGNYHSRTPQYHRRYVALVDAAHRHMLKTGKF